MQIEEAQRRLCLEQSAEGAAAGYEARGTGSWGALQDTVKQDFGFDSC